MVDSSMNRKILSVGTIVMIVCIGLSGCTDQTENTDEIELVSYSVTTEAYSHKTGWKNFGEGFQPDALPEIVTRDPPYLSEEYTRGRYNITVTVKNIAGYDVSKILITLNFYDTNDSQLFSKQLNDFNDFPDTHTRVLGWEYDIDDSKYGKYFEDIRDMNISMGAQSINIQPDP